MKQKVEITILEPRREVIYIPMPVGNCEESFTDTLHEAAYQAIRNHLGIDDFDYSMTFVPANEALEDD